MIVVRVKQLVPDNQLDPEDLDDKPGGCYFYNVKTKKQALDRFHLTEPIACLEHYEITAEKLKTFTNGQALNYIYSPGVKLSHVDWNGREWVTFERDGEAVDESGITINASFFVVNTDGWYYWEKP